MPDLTLTNLNRTLAEYYNERQRMELGEKSKDICLDCGKGYDFCICSISDWDKLSDEALVNFEQGLDSTSPTVTLRSRPRLPSDAMIARDNKQAFDLLYNTSLEVGDIIQRGIRDGKKGYKRALYQAQEKLRGIE